MRVVDSEPLGVALVALAIAGIVATAHRMRSETVAGIALFLGLHTGMLSEVTALSLIATTLARRRRRVLPREEPLGDRAAVDGRRGLLDPRDARVRQRGRSSPELRVAFVGIDFALFAAALLIGPRSRRARARAARRAQLARRARARQLRGRPRSRATRCSRSGAFAATRVVLAAIARVARVRRGAHDRGRAPARARDRHARARAAGRASMAGRCSRAGSCSRSSRPRSPAAPRAAFTALALVLCRSRRSTRGSARRRRRAARVRARDVRDRALPRAADRASPLRAVRRRRRRARPAPARARCAVGFTRSAGSRRRSCCSRSASRCAQRPIAGPASRALACRRRPAPRGRARDASAATSGS